MKKTYLLDTNIVSEFSKQHPNKRVIELYKSRKDQCAMSAVTWQELVRGIERLPEGKRKRYLAECLSEYEASLEVIPYDKFSARICGEMQAGAEHGGKTLPFYDSQIAATAIANGMVLVTHNMADFEPMQEKSFLRMEDWMETETA